MLPKKRVITTSASRLRGRNWLQNLDLSSRTSINDLVNDRVCGQIPDIAMCADSEAALLILGCQWPHCGPSDHRGNPYMGLLDIT